MPTYTKYKKIEKPLALERYNIDVVNKNNDIIDSELHKLELKNESQDNLLATKEALNVEVLRATTRENALDDSLSGEISRAQSAEIKISNSLESEVNRATTTEAAIRKNLSDHNISDSSHNDIRLLISGLTERLNALADSDDTTLDQLSEIVAYIKNNKSLIENVTTSKVDVSDIIDSLTSTATNKPLSAKQGRILKDLIDALTTTVGNKVDKVSGKGLSTNDYTTTEKNKLDGIASGAEVNVQSDWNITDSTSDAYIKNKPTAIKNPAALTFTGGVNATYDGSIAKSVSIPTALPASDVYEWAKAETKPSYSKSEVGLGNVPNVTTNNQTPTFTEAKTRESINSGETTSTLWGKVKKWFSDLKTVAFSGKYKDLDEKPYVNGLQMSDGNTDFVVCSNAATEKNKTVTKSEWTHAEGSRIRILFKNGCTVASNIQVMPVPLSLALVKNTNGDPFLTNETGVIYEFTWYNAKLVLTGSTGGGSVDPSDITPSSIGAVAKTGDTMTGRLEIKTPSASPTAAKLVTGDEGNQRIFYGSDSIESVTPDNAIGILKLNPEGNGNNGRVVIGSPLHVAGGLSVDNALGNVFANMRDFRFLPVFNGYTGNAGTGGIFGYLERKACGLAPFWHWTTSGNYEAYYYKITVGAKDIDAGIVNWMISFELTVYQSYRYCKFAISGYVYNCHNEDGSYELIWYEPRAEMIAGDREINIRAVWFGKDTDGHLYVAVYALAYTGLVIDAVNIAFQDIVVDYSSLFSLSVEPTLDNTTKYANILTSRPFYLNEANELKNSVSNGKAMVASAITAKGVSTAADADFLTMANNIGNIYRGTRMIGSVVGVTRISNAANCTVSFSVSNKDLSGANYVNVHIVAVAIYTVLTTMSLSGDLVVGDSEWGKQTQNGAEIRKASYMLEKKNNYSITLSVGGSPQNYATAFLVCYYGVSF